ncbi:MAG: hypothetical protein ACK45R_06930 [Candidatus Kapaibacterium sp.]|jgi:hypothetical protein
MNSPQPKMAGSQLSVSRHPHSYYKELAEMGSLYDFLLEYMEDDFRSNHEFHREMLRLLIDNKELYGRGVEEEFIYDLGQALRKFTEKLEHAATVRIE